jgi:acyl carrier protein
MADFGLNKNIHLSDRLDSDGDIEMIMRAPDEDVTEWLDKTQAQAIIAHLQRVFGLVGDNGDVDVQGKIIKVLTGQLGMREGDVTADSTHDGLGMDSLDDVEVIMAIEEVFDLDISDCDAKKLQSVQQATAYVVGRLADHD